MGYVRVRPDITTQELDRPEQRWMCVGLTDLEGYPLHWRPDNEWVKAIAFDAMSTGLYVLTDDDDYYFVCHSVDLEYKNEIPESEKALFATTYPKPRERAKHAGTYDLRYDLSEARDTMFEELGQELDTWQLLARDLARDILRGKYLSPDSYSFARDILNRLAKMPEMNIHPSELSGTGRAK